MDGVKVLKRPKPVPAGPKELPPSSGPAHDTTAGVDAVLVQAQTQTHTQTQGAGVSGQGAGQAQGQTQGQSEYEMKMKSYEECKAKIFAAKGGVLEPTQV